MQLTSRWRQLPAKSLTDNMLYKATISHIVRYWRSNRAFLIVAVSGCRPLSNRISERAAKPAAGACSKRKCIQQPSLSDACRRDSPQTRLAPDALGPTVAIGEILVEIMAKVVATASSNPSSSSAPTPAERRLSSSTSAPGSAARRRLSPRSAMTISAASTSTGCGLDGADVRPSRSAPTSRPEAPLSATATMARATSSITSGHPRPHW